MLSVSSDRSTSLTSLNKREGFIDYIIKKSRNWCSFRHGWIQRLKMLFGIYFAPSLPSAIFFVDHVVPHSSFIFTSCFFNSLNEMIMTFFPGVLAKF